MCFKTTSLNPLITGPHYPTTQSMFILLCLQITKTNTANTGVLPTHTATKEHLPLTARDTPPQLATIQPTCPPQPSNKGSATAPFLQQSATPVPPPQQVPSTTRSYTQTPGPPRFSCYPQEPPPLPQPRHNSSSTYGHPPTQSTLYPTSTKHYSAAVSSPIQTTQPYMTNMR